MSRPGYLFQKNPRQSATNSGLIRVLIYLLLLFLLGAKKNLVSRIREPPKSGVTHAIMDSYIFYGFINLFCVIILAIFIGSLAAYLVQTCLVSYLASQVIFLVIVLNVHLSYWRESRTPMSSSIASHLPDAI